MMRAAVAEARAFESWLDYQEALKRAIAPLTDEQLQRRSMPGRRTPGEIAEHIVFGRALHLRRAVGDRAAGVAFLLRWDDPDDPPRSAAEILEGLELTWQVIADLLTHGSASDTLTGDEVEVLQSVWGLLDHDLPHAGQLSLVLRSHGLPGVDL